MVLETTLETLPKAAKKVLKSLKDGDVIGLQGPLAAGKTTLTAALLLQMGYEGYVTSPTFVLERRYPVAYKNIREVVHLDFYRLNAVEIAALDWRDHAGLPGTLTIIEWPENAAGLLPPDIKQVKIGIIDGQTRHLTFSDNFAA